MPKGPQLGVTPYQQEGSRQQKAYGPKILQRRPPFHYNILSQHENSSECHEKTGQVVVKLTFFFIGDQLCQRRWIKLLVDCLMMLMVMFVIFDPCRNRRRQPNTRKQANSQP